MNVSEQGYNHNNLLERKWNVVSLQQTYNLIIVKVELKFSQSLVSFEFTNAFYINSNL